MILGARYPDILITPIAHGTPLDPVHPYTYISALYNTIVCVGIGVLVTYLQPLIQKTSDQIRRSRSHKLIIDTMIVMIVLSLLLVWFNIGPHTSLTSCRASYKNIMAFCCIFCQSRSWSEGLIIRMGSNKQNPIHFYLQHSIWQRFPQAKFFPKLTPEFPVPRFLQKFS